jgi:hypothetical protein
MLIDVFAFTDMPIAMTTKITQRNGSGLQSTNHTGDPSLASAFQAQSRRSFDSSQSVKIAA